MIPAQQGINRTTQKVGRREKARNGDISCLHVFSSVYFGRAGRGAGVLQTGDTTFTPLTLVLNHVSATPASDNPRLLVLIRKAEGINPYQNWC